MKKSIFLLIIVFTATLLSFTEEKTENSGKNRKLVNIIFSGKIENSNFDTISVFNNNRELLKTIRCKSDHTFRDTLKLDEGYYKLRIGREYTQVYLKAQFDLSLSLDTKEFDESIVYKGVGSKENNYLAQKILLRESFGKLNSPRYHASLSEEAFLKLTDSLHTVTNNLFKASQNVLDPDFKFIESKSLEFEKLNKISHFEGMRRFFTENPDFKVSDNYPNPFANIDLSNEKFLISPDYPNFIQSYLRKKTRDKINESDKSIDFILEYLKTIQSEVTNAKIIEELAYSIGKRDFSNSSQKESLYAQMKPLISNKKHLAEITEKYKKLKKIEKGSISPVFELSDINGKLVSLKSLQGKLVYIDIWAPWCMPCIKEIPSLKKMEEHYQGKEIEFVSICVRDTEERWRSTVAKKELGGIQLFAPDNSISFFKDYGLEGIPRFILLGKDGRIIDADAKRPSDPMLNAEIESYLY